MIKIEFAHWHTSCGDRCCDDWGTELRINGETITRDTSMDADELKAVLNVMNIDIEFTIEVVSEYDDE